MLWPTSLIARRTPPVASKASRAWDGELVADDFLFALPAENNPSDRAGSLVDAAGQSRRTLHLQGGSGVLRQAGQLSLFSNGLRIAGKPHSGPALGILV